MKFINQLKFDAWTIDRKEYRDIVSFVKKTKAKRILEIGPGVSTYAFLECDCQIESWEPNKEWFAIFKRRFQKHNVPVNLLSESGPTINGRYDIVFVDSGPRIKLIKKCGPFCDHIILHDANRIAGPLNELRTKGWNVSIRKRGRGLAIIKSPRKPN
jgi:hypothetical protein